MPTGETDAKVRRFNANRRAEELALEARVDAQNARNTEVIARNCTEAGITPDQFITIVASGKVGSSDLLRMMKENPEAVRTMAASLPPIPPDDELADGQIPLL